MKYKILAIIVIVVLLGIFSTKFLYTDSMDIDNNTLVISVCTGNMRGLETGISVYAGYNKAPLVLSDRTLPQQLDSWLPSFIKKNNIKKIVVVGPITAKQLLQLHMCGVEVKQVYGKSIPDILTKVADNTPTKNNDTLIFSASDPLAGVLGAYIKTPVFITATNETYNSADVLDTKYDEYIKTHNISHIIIVGNLPESLKNQLKSYNTTIEELSGRNSVDVSINVNNKLKSLGLLNNTTQAYYGFYGELPTIVPLVIQNNAMLIEDSSNHGDISDYIKENNVSKITLTRNTESDYIQMEESDYISSKIIDEFRENNIDTEFLTNNRTLDEATGLYDVKINSIENVKNHTKYINNTTTGKSMESNPPLIEMLNYTSVVDSNNISANITNNNNTYNVKWSTIHPYTWKKISNNAYYATSNTGYEYFWNYDENTWTVDYKYNNTSYYQVKWIKNTDNTWTEMHPTNNYTWNYDGNKWACYKNSQMIYYISKK